MLWLDLIGSMMILLWDSFALVQMFRTVEELDQEYCSIMSPECMKLLERQHQNKDNGN